MASSSSWSLKIAGGGRKSGGDLPQRPRYSFPSLQVNPARRRRMSAAAGLETHHTSSISPAKFDALTYFSGRARDGRDRISPQKLDDWMRESVGEIVKNIGKAPFLLRIFSDEFESKRLSSSESSGLMIEKEAATAESWSGIKKRWEQESSVPDGVILVEELDAEEDEEEEEGGDRSNVRLGVVIQGRGMDCSACYILNTCKVRSSMGFCTHFCLVRAKCFGDPVGVQLKNVWLQSER